MEQDFARGQEMGGIIIHAEGVRFAFPSSAGARKVFRFQDEIRAQAENSQFAAARRPVARGFARWQKDPLPARNSYLFTSGAGSLFASKVGSFLASAEEAVGLADIESKREFTVDDVCWIASITKPYTATLLVMLAAQGKLSLDEPVDKYLPAFAEVQVRGQGPAKTRPNLRQLLSHTGGFPAGPFGANQ